MTGTEDTGSRASLRRGAAIDLLFWLAAIAGIVAIGFVMALAKVPVVPREIFGEPAAMIALCIATVAILRRRGQDWRDLGLRRPVSARRTVRLVALGLFSVFAANAILVLAVYRPLHLAPPHAGLIQSLIRTPQTFAAMLLLASTTVAFGEEFQFRGFLFSRLETLFGGARGATVAAWLAQALLFGLPHAYQGLAGVISTGVIGLVLGGLYLRAGRNLIACIAVHALVDTLSLTALYAATRLGIPVN